MTEQTQSTQSAETFVDRQRRLLSEAAVEIWKNDRTRDRRLAEIINPGRGKTLGQVITLDYGQGHVMEATGSYAVEVIVYADGEPHMWTTVHAGKSDHTYFYGPDMAMLHLIARRASPDGRGSDGVAAAYAARVLGLPDDGDRRA